MCLRSVWWVLQLWQPAAYWTAYCQQCRMSTQGVNPRGFHVLKVADHLHVLQLCATQKEGHQSVGLVLRLWWAAAPRWVRRHGVAQGWLQLRSTA